jgi:nickel transport protein
VRIRTGLAAPGVRPPAALGRLCVSDAGTASTDGHPAVRNRAQDPPASWTHVLPWILALGSLLGSASAAAHKLKVFAAAEGARIQGSAYFAGRAGAGGARVEVRDAQGRVLADLTPDAQGRFAYMATAPVDHLILARTGDGHQASWTIRGAELAGVFASAIPPRVEPVSPAAPGQAVTSATATPPVPVAGLDPAAVAACEAAVARQVRPLREALEAAQDRARLHDILGGIGYILGISGLGLWWGARRQGRQPVRGA